MARIEHIASLSLSLIYLSIFRKHTDIAPPVRVWREVWHDGKRAPGIFRQATGVIRIVRPGRRRRRHRSPCYRSLLTPLQIRA